MRTKKGVITSAKMQGTVSVTVHAHALHSVYKKRFRKSKKFLADTGDITDLVEGDTVASMQGAMVTPEQLQETVVNSIVEATNAQAAAIQLQNQSIVPIAINEVEEKNKSALSLNIAFKKKVKHDDLIMLCRQMRALTRAGIPIIQAIAGLADISKSEQIKEALSDVNVRLATGSSLANALSAHGKIFNSMFVSMIHVGENTGRLEDAFAKLISHIEMERDTRNRMTQAMRYPMFVVGAMFVAMMIVNMFVIPQFAKVFAKVGQCYALYLPTAKKTGTLDLAGVQGRYKKQWYNPREGRFEGSASVVSAGSKVSLGRPPNDASMDWAVLLIRGDDVTDAGTTILKAAQAAGVYITELNNAKTFKAFREIHEGQPNGIYSEFVFTQGDTIKQ